MGKVFKPYLKELATGPAEELAWEAEKLPEFREEMERLQDLRDELTALVGEESAGELITAARGVNVPIYEYCYKVLKRVTYGMPNFRKFRARILHCCSKVIL